MILLPLSRKGGRNSVAESRTLQPSQVAHHLKPAKRPATVSPSRRSGDSLAWLGLGSLKANVVPEKKGHVPNASKYCMLQASSPYGVGRQATYEETLDPGLLELSLKHTGITWGVPSSLSCSPLASAAEKITRRGLDARMNRPIRRVTTDLAPNVALVQL
jgi:hypothetical protein